MTKKDYVLIAAAVHDALQALTTNEDFNEGLSAQKHAIARCLAERLALENSRFDRARFLAACGVQS